MERARSSLSLLGLVWGLAAVGVALELCLRRERRVVSHVLYVLMGWMAIAAIAPLSRALGWEGFSWLAAGGALYTLGIAFYAVDARLRHAHGVWHLFVLAGSATHYGAILRYVA